MSDEGTLTCMFFFVVTYFIVTKCVKSCDTDKVTTTVKDNDTLER